MLETLIALSLYFPFRRHLEAIDRPGNPGDPVPAQRGSPVEEKLERPDSE